MLLEVRSLLWRIRERIASALRAAGRVTRFAVKSVIAAGSLTAAAQGVALVAAWWDDGLLQSDLVHALGGHQSTRLMEHAMALRVSAEGHARASVQVLVTCPSPGEPGPLEKIAPTCLLTGDVRYERTVLLVTRHVRLQPSKTVFRDSIPRR